MRRLSQLIERKAGKHARTSGLFQQAPSRSVLAESPCRAARAQHLDVTPRVRQFDSQWLYDIFVGA